MIIPEEAVLVRRIYREYLEGYSPVMIAGRLTAEGIKTPAGKDNWYQSTIVSILGNEKYCGSLLMQKYYVADFLTHKIVKNEGGMPQYFVEDHHEPIVPKDVYYQVQGEMQRRSLLKYEPGKIRFGSTELLKGRLYCGICGRVLKKYKNPDPAKTDWRCRNRAYEKHSVSKEVESACKLRNAPEREVKRAILYAINELPWKRDELIRLQGGIWNGGGGENFENSKNGVIDQIDEEIGKVQEQQKRLGERLDSLVDDQKSGEADFLKEEMEMLEMEYTRLVLKRAEAANRDIHIRVLLELVDAMRMKAGAKLPGTGGHSGGDNHTDGHTDDGSACYDYDEFFKRTRYVVDESVIGGDGKIRNFSNDLILRYLDKVIVNEKDYEVWFKAGVKETVDLEKMNRK